MAEIRSCVNCKYYSPSLLKVECAKTGIGLNLVDLVLKARNCEYFTPRYAKEKATEPSKL